MTAGRPARSSSRGPGLDHPATTAERRRALGTRRGLREVYAEWYRRLSGRIPGGPGEVLELGSGGGFLGEFVPDAIRSDVCPYSWLDLALDGQALPFRDGSLRGIVMTNVLHHLPRPALFFDEAARCVRPQGVVAMVEPWFTPWSGFVYRHFHHEPFQPEAKSWEAPPGGPLSGANGALPWIILLRDRARFRSEHPQWAIRSIEPVMPISYLLTGGFTFRSPVPGRFVAAVVRAERRWTSLSRRFALFAVILLERETTAP